MSNNHSDDDVIVISEDEARYETRDENAAVDPADDDELAANDQATPAVPGEAGRYGSMTSPGEAAASDASDLHESDLEESDLDEPGLDADADPDTHPVTEPVTLVSSSDGTGAEAPGYSGTLAADRADAAASDSLTSGTLASDTLANGTGTVNGSGSAIPMPGSSTAPAASATPAATPAVGATPDSNWPQIQSLFVDDPLAAVQQAADVVGGALAALTAAANNREQTLRGGWQGAGTGTEELRTALREYRDLAGRLSTLAQDL
jgi:hypothetical protein